MKKLKKVLKIAIVVEVLSIPVLAALLSNSSCKNNGTDCGLAGFGALYMIFPIALTVLLYLIIKAFELTNKTQQGNTTKHMSLWILLSALSIIGIGFWLYFLSVT
jgi:uncharacterized membrane protein